MGTNVSRRAVIKGAGALVVGFSAMDGLPAAAAGSPAPAGPPRPDQLDSWLRVQADGLVKVFTGRVELGQGNATALGQIVAEELDVPFERVQLVMGDTASSVDEGMT